MHRSAKKLAVYGMQVDLVCLSVCLSIGLAACLSIFFHILQWLAVYCCMHAVQYRSALGVYYSEQSVLVGQAIGPA